MQLAASERKSQGRLLGLLIALAVVGGLVLWRGLSAEPAPSSSSSSSGSVSGGPQVGLGSTPQPVDARRNWPADSDWAPASGATPRGDQEPHTDAASPAARGAKADWWAVLDVLDERRAQVLARANLSGIASYAAAGSAFASSEAQLVGDLLDDGLRPRAWRTSIIAVEGVDESREAHGTESVVITVVDKRAAFELVDATGHVVRSVAVSGKRRWRLTLVRPRGGDTGPIPGSPAPSPEAGERGGGWSAPAEEGLADARSAVADDALGIPDGGSEASATDVPRSESPAPMWEDAASPDPANRTAGPASGPAAPGAVLAWRISAVELVE